MKAVTLTATATLMLAALSGTMSAQRRAPAPDEKFLKPPVFLIMPGALTSCVISCPAPGTSNTDFNARFQTVIPTSSPWLAFVGGLQWGWFDEDAHGPIGFFGGIIPLVPVNNALGGWLSLSIDPLGVVTGPGGNGTDFVLEAAAVMPLGAKLMPTASPFWRSFGLYFLIDQQINNLPPINAAGDRDRFNPALVYGVMFQIAP